MNMSLVSIVIPSVICLVWFAFIGATAIDLELSGAAQGSIVNADISAQLFKTINLILSPELAVALSVVIVILLLTFLVTSADSGILIINTLASGGNQSQKHTKHVVIWGVIFALLIGVLLSAGGNGCTAIGDDYRGVAFFIGYGPHGHFFSKGVIN